jgi:hypothetical protein
MAVAVLTVCSGFSSVVGKHTSLDERSSEGARARRHAASLTASPPRRPGGAEDLAQGFCK